ALAATAWIVSTGHFAWARIQPGPRTAPEIGRMLTTSVVIPPSATWHWTRGWLRHRRARPWSQVASSAVAAVLLDRDGTLVSDVPYNGEPNRVEPVPGTRAALDRLRAAGIPLGVITNQSGIARGLLTDDQVHAVNARIE